jgi:uncharacterized protein (TIGR00730 family)
MGYSSIYRKAAEDLASYLSANNYGLVYGGADVGLMKVLADTMLKNNREVIGIMPHNLVRKEVAHHNLTEMIIVDTMAERKDKMVELSDCFVAIPGGYGTFDELSEILTFNQLRITDKPLGMLNVDGYFDLLIKFYHHAVTEGFVRQEHFDNLIVSDDIDTVFRKMGAYKPLTMGKWIKDIKVESSAKR